MTQFGLEYQVVHLAFDPSLYELKLSRLDQLKDWTDHTTMNVQNLNLVS